jgi:hypothetical protein
LATIGVFIVFMSSIEIVAGSGRWREAAIWSTPTATL